MRTLDMTEVNEVSGGTFGLLSSLFSCLKPKVSYCAPAPVSCAPAAPAPCAPVATPKPKKGC